MKERWDVIFTLNVEIALTTPLLVRVKCLVLLAHIVMIESEGRLLVDQPSMHGMLIIRMVTGC